MTQITYKGQTEDFVSKNMAFIITTFHIKAAVYLKYSSDKVPVPGQVIFGEQHLGVFDGLAYLLATILE